MTYSTDVTFNAGAPIDVNKLNQLQSNINEIFKSNSDLQNTTNSLGKAVRVFPVIDVGTVKIKVNAATATIVPFANPNFTEKPSVVASLASNLPVKGGTEQYSVRATTQNESNFAVEVTSTTGNSGQEVEVNYIAIQMKSID